MQDVFTSYNSGRTLYFHVMKGLDYTSDVWNGSSFEPYDVAHWSLYSSNPLAETALEAYSGTFPSGVTTRGVFYIMAYEQLGGSPQSMDLAIRQGGMDWTGNSESFGGGGSETFTVVLGKTSEVIEFRTGQSPVAFDQFNTGSSDTSSEEEFITGDTAINPDSFTTGKREVSSDDFKTGAR